jgi:hypothetical protein
MDLKYILTPGALTFELFAVYVLLVNVGVWQDLVSHDSRVRRWLFEPKGEYTYFLAFGLLWIGFTMQIAAAFLD